MPTRVTSMLWTRGTFLSSAMSYNFLVRARCFCSRTSMILENDECERPTQVPNYSSKIHLSPLFSDGRPHVGGYNIELVDNDTWQVSSGLAHAWRGLDSEMESKNLTGKFDEEIDDCSAGVEGDPDFDEIDNLRVRGNLFYKLDRNSREFEEYSFDFHRRKGGSKEKCDHKESKKKDSLKNKNEEEDHKESKKNKNPIRVSVSGSVNVPKLVKDEMLYTVVDNIDGPHAEKRKRIPTFNQLTGPYHEPFCLDIYISKASVRACIIHRATSKVVSVAHSISKDMKFDLGSTRNATACASVGGILAQRALDDDIHDVIYTPRKGEKLEGKLQIVLQAIIDNGVNVKVKLKQRKKKHSYLSTA